MAVSISHEGEAGWHFGEDGVPEFDDMDLWDALFSGRATNVLSTQPRNPIEGKGINPNPEEVALSPIDLEEGLEYSLAPAQV